MSFYKAIEHGKEHRKWIGKSGYSKSVDKQCRNHGACEWCKGNRIFKFKKDKMKGCE